MELAVCFVRLSGFTQTMVGIFVNELVWGPRHRQLSEHCPWCPSCWPLWRCGPPLVVRPVSAASLPHTFNTPSQTISPIGSDFTLAAPSFQSLLALNRSATSFTLFPPFSSAQITVNLHVVLNLTKFYYLRISWIGFTSVSIAYTYIFSFL